MTRKRRILSTDEQMLWDQIAQNINPLRSKNQSKVNLFFPKKVVFSLPSEKESITFLQEEFSFSPSSDTRRLQRVGKVTLEARLDLHGFTQKQAYSSLVHFLQTCHQKQYVWVLIITGKGLRQKDQNHFDTISKKQTLRLLTPQWLDQNPLRNIVSAYAPAKPRDGGQGALYVRLRGSFETNIVNKRKI